MAPSKISSKSSSKTSSKKSGSTKVNKGSSVKSRPSSKSKVAMKAKAPPPVQQKTKSQSGPVKKKRRVYTDKELGLPKLNMITPVGVDLPKGKKKGKVFVDDQESMMTILAIVNASKEGQIESKMLKARHLEEIREARRKETEARQEQRKVKLEETKESIRWKRKRRPDTDTTDSIAKADTSTIPSKKKVAFAS